MVRAGAATAAATAPCCNCTCAPWRAVSIRIASSTWGPWSDEMSWPPVTAARSAAASGVARALLSVAAARGSGVAWPRADARPTSPRAGPVSARPKAARFTPKPGSLSASAELASPRAGSASLRAGPVAPKGTNSLKLAPGWPKAAMSPKGQPADVAAGVAPGARAGAVAPSAGARSPSPLPVSPNVGTWSLKAGPADTGASSCAPSTWRLSALIFPFLSSTTL
mmetsp:Transcript_29138/g.79987  ORF Transcript_29138/g.79987 Transcript_29138/m.79987 type:complete len:224 (+) Transcript_29138:699-1370(+)